MKKIPLTKGEYAIVDDTDFDFLNQWKWFLSWNGYAKRNSLVNENKKKCKYVWMHRVINKTPKGFITDHINRNKLDNRKKNLRTADKSLNSINRDKQSNNTSGVRGVYFDSWSKRWRAELVINGKRLTLGRFADMRDAIKARLMSEQKHYAI